MPDSPLHVLVLAGGPDRERGVSLASGAAVADALRRAGHAVTERDLTPNDTGALDAFVDEAMHVVFPVLHGPWGEGGGAQTLLEARGLPYVGTRADAAAHAMDKQRTKATYTDLGLPTPAAAVVTRDEPWPATVAPPCVVKPVDEGSSIHLSICRDAMEATLARAAAHAEHDRLMLEAFVDPAPPGCELTVGVLGTGDDAAALPALEIRPADDAAFYDFDAKYQRDDTVYDFDINLPPATLDAIRDAALTAHRALGCRHLSRTDVMVDAAGAWWLLETNTLPGFTDHSLLPKAAAHAGTPMHMLCDRLVRWALEDA